MPLTEHEPRDRLPAEVVDHRRAFESIIEELEAVAWYHERAAAAGDEGLRDVLIHNRNEEIEHAMMGLEWVRRRIPEFDEHMRTYLFTSAPITKVEELAEAGEGGEGDNPGGGSADAAAGSLNIGSMKKGG